MKTYSHGKEKVLTLLRENYELHDKLAMSGRSVMPLLHKQIAIEMLKAIAILKDAYEGDK